MSEDTEKPVVRKHDRPLEALADLAKAEAAKRDRTNPTGGASTGPTEVNRSSHTSS
jgi:hypothetical protein